MIACLFQSGCWKLSFWRQSEEKEYIHITYFQHSWILFEKPILCSKSCLYGISSSWREPPYTVSLYQYVFWSSPPNMCRSLTLTEGSFLLDLLCLIKKPLFSQNCCCHCPSNLRKVFSKSCSTQRTIISVCLPLWCNAAY